MLHNVLHRVLPQAVVDRHCSDNTASEHRTYSLVLDSSVHVLDEMVKLQHLFCKTVKRRRLMHNSIRVHLKIRMLVLSSHQEVGRENQEGRGVISDKHL